MYEEEREKGKVRKIEVKHVYDYVSDGLDFRDTRLSM